MDHEIRPDIRPTRKQLVDALAALVVEALRRARLNVPESTARGKKEARPSAAEAAVRSKD